MESLQVPARYLQSMVAATDINTRTASARRAITTPPVSAGFAERDAKREVAQLIAQIAHHDRLYYQLDVPEITDSADALRTRLAAIERRFPRSLHDDKQTLAQHPYINIGSRQRRHQD